MASYMLKNQDNRLKISDSAVSMRLSGSDPTVSMRPLDQILECQWDSRIRLGHFCKRFHSLNETGEADSAVSLKPRDPFLRWQWDQGIVSRGFNDTTGSDPTVSMRPRDPLILRGIIHKKNYWLPFPLKGNQSKSHTYAVVSRKRKY
jgi:hypothetical protein